MSLRAQLLIIATLLGVPALYWSISTGMLTLVERSRLNSPDGKVQARVVSRGDWNARTHVYLEIREPGSVTYVPLETLSGPDEILAESYALNWLDQKTVRVLGRTGDFTRYWDIEIGPEKIYFELRTTPPDPIPKASPDSQPGKNAKTAARNGLSPSRGQALAWNCSGSLPDCLILGGRSRQLSDSPLCPQKDGIGPFYPVRYSSQPLRYSRPRKCSASGALGNFRLAASHCNFLPAR